MAETRTFTSTRGGVMTVEVGSVTGDLELSAEDSCEGIIVRVRYVGAAEWYTVEGSPVSGTSAELAGIGDHILTRLTTPGEKNGFNEEPCTLEGL